MLATLSLFRREFSAYFLSPIAYVVLAVFLAVTGHLFYLTLEQLTATGPEGTEFLMRSMLGDERFWLVFLFIPPLLTMRLFAEERSSGTLEMLMTAPLHDWQVVLSKYLACFAFYVVLWLPTLIYLPILLSAETPQGRIDPMPVVSSYLGLFLAGAMFLALGLFISSLVRSQMVSALISLFLSLLFIMAGFWRPDMNTGSLAYRVLFFFSVPLHFQNDFSRGLVDTRHVVLYVSVTLFCLFLTVRSLESRRWR
ncbi:MAG TPA: ABC transporter permease [Gemmataceae bacterium]|jgi:ABC-2 type transport system permease protein|nr:ABC transporter permease [Gemmataceae bacterium]